MIGVSDIDLSVMPYSFGFYRGYNDMLALEYF